MGSSRIASVESDGASQGRARKPRPRPRGTSPTLLRLIAGGTIPLFALIWFFLLSAEKRQSILDAIPSGVAERAIAAGIAFGVLVALAWLTFPAAYAGLVGTRRCTAWFRLQRGGRRVLLFPFEAVTTIFYGVFGGLFAVNAVLIIGMFFLSLLFVGWIVRPDLLWGQERFLEFIREVGERVGW